MFWNVYLPEVALDKNIVIGLSRRAQAMAADGTRQSLRMWMDEWVREMADSQPTWFAQ